MLHTMQARTITILIPMQRVRKQIKFGFIMMWFYFYFIFTYIYFIFIILYGVFLVLFL